MKIIKRDGSLQEFKREKIINAIVKAMADDTQKGVDYELAKQISQDIEIESLEDKVYSVEEIQDIIEELLMCYDRYNTARMYIRYRLEHEQGRNRRTEIANKVLDVVTCKDVKNANANLDEYSFGGRKFESAGVVHKQIALDELMRPEVAEAHRKGRLYQHDLDSYSVGMHNCFSRETKFITSLGTKSFNDFVDGEEIFVPTHTGEWKKATVRNYGKQQLFNLHFKRGNSEVKIIKATKNHRWFLKDGTVTDSIKIGDKLLRTPNINNFDFNSSSKEEKQMWIYGFACADGVVIDNGQGPWGTRIRLCNNKREKYENRFLELGYSSCSEKHIGKDKNIYIQGFLKEIPSFKDEKMIKAFINGVFDADGSATTSAKSIQLTGEKMIALVNNYFETAGFYIGAIKDLTDQVTNFGKRTDTTKRIMLSEEQAHFYWTLKNIEEASIEDVWCLEVEDNKSFILSGGIVTGNCLFIDFNQLLSNGFSTRNGDVRPPNSISTAFQQMAVIFQCQSQVC